MFQVAFLAILIAFILDTALGLSFRVVLGAGWSLPHGPFLVAVAAVSFWPCVATATKRLHDRNRPARYLWLLAPWVLISNLWFVPFIGLAILCTDRGVVGDTAHGPAASARLRALTAS